MVEQRSLVSLRGISQTMVVFFIFPLSYLLQLACNELLSFPVALFCENHNDLNPENLILEPVVRTTSYVIINKYNSLIPTNTVRPIELKILSLSPC